MPRPAPSSCPPLCPDVVMSRVLFGEAGDTAAVLGPLAPRSAGVRWTTSPQGAVPRLMIFDGEGRLWPAAVAGVSAVAPAGAGTCRRLGASPVRIPLQRELYRWPWLAEFGYSGPATTVGLNFAGGWHFVRLPAGHHDVLAQLPGAGSSVTIHNIGLAQAGCMTYLTVGTLQPSPFGSPVPAEPVSG